MTVRNIEEFMNNRIRDWMIGCCALIVVICILAFAIVIGGVMIVIWTKIVQKTLAEINRLSALCPTLPWFKKSFCWAALAGLLTIVIAACGLFFTAAAVVSINILVVALSFL